MLVPGCMKRDWMRRGHNNNLKYFLFTSCALHLAFVFSLPSSSSSPSDSPSLPLKEPVWVDIVESSNPPASETTSLSPTTEKIQLAEKQQLPKAQDPIIPEPLSKLELEDVSLPKGLKKTDNMEGAGPVQTVSGPKHEPVKKISSENIRKPSELNKMIPTMQSLLDMEKPKEKAIVLAPKSRNSGKKTPSEIKYDKYLMGIKTRVEKNWKITLNTMIQEGTTIVGARMNADGSLYAIDLLQPSGMISNDYEALEAVQQLFPLRPPPETMLNRDGKLSIRFFFHYL